MVLPVFHALLMGKPCVAFRSRTDDKRERGYVSNQAQTKVEDSKPCGKKHAVTQIGEVQPDHDLGHIQANVENLTQPLLAQISLPQLGEKTGTGHDSILAQANLEGSTSHYDDRFLPSIDKVVAGHQPSLTQKKVTNSQAPPLLLGDKAHCMEDAITDNGPCLWLADEERGTHTVFKYNIEATNVAVHLVNQPATMCGYGVEATHMIGLLDIKREEEHVKSWNLLTHPESRGSVATCFNTRDASLMIGSPGIGKSWSLLYALQQALLYNNALVLLYACKHSKTYLFRRQGNKIYAWKATNNRKAVSSIMGRHDCLVLYDPAEANRGGADFDEGACQTIVAMSANKRHATSDALKINFKGKCFFGVPSKNQLSVMTPLMESTDSTDVILSRIHDVGPIARYILSDEGFQFRLHQRASAIERIKGNPLLLEKYLNSNGMKSPKEGDDFFPETIFITTGTRCKVYGKVSDAPFTLLGGQLSESKEDENRKCSPAASNHQGAGPNKSSEYDLDQDYEGQDTNYKMLQIVPVCANALTDLLVECRATILSYFGKITAGDFIKFGDTFEQIGLHDLCSPYKLTMKRKLLKHKKSKGKLVTEQDDTPSAEENVAGAPEEDADSLVLLKGRIYHNWTEKLFSEVYQKLPDVLHSSTNAVASMPPGFLVIDAAASDSQVFQITLNIKHTLSAEGVEDLLKSAGFINADGMRSEKCFDREGKKADILEFYWLVHHARYAEWCKRAPKSFKSKNQEVEKCWDKNVVQYALELSTKGPDLISVEEPDPSASSSTVAEI
jgi:hypothetical protein